MKSLRKKILASALAVTLVGGVFAPKASATQGEEEEKNPIIWDDLKITKVLNKVEKGVTTPDAEFEFALTPKVKGDPTIENVKISFKAEDNEDADTGKPGIQVENTVGVNLSKVEWKEAKIYEYTLKEVIPEPGIKDMDYAYGFDRYGKVSKQGSKNFDGFKIKFKVEEVNGKLEVTGITVAGRYGKFTPKINYDEKKGVKFINYYDKKDGNTPNPGGGTDITPEDKKGFAFKKTVETKYPEDKDKPFEFTVKVDKAVGSNSKDTEFKYVIVDKDGSVGGEQSVAYGTEFKVNLKHNERVVFTDVILGSKVSVEETNTQKLKPSITSKFFEKDTTASDDKTKVAGYIGDQEGGNFAEITNTNDDTPLTGVLIDNLPYIALVAVAGLGIFFFVKNKREEEIYA